MRPTKEAGPVRPPRSRFERWRRALRFYLLRLIRIKDNRASVVRGIGIGVAVHSIPLFGFSLLAGLALAFPFRANKAAVTLANLMSAPVTLPIYSLNLIVIKLTIDRLKPAAEALGLLPRYAYFSGTIFGIASVFFLLYLASTLGAALALRGLDRHLAERRRRRRAERTSRSDRAAVPAVKSPLSSEEIPD